MAQYRMTTETDGTITTEWDRYQHPVDSQGLLDMRIEPVFIGVGHETYRPVDQRRAFSLYGAPSIESAVKRERGLVWVTTDTEHHGYLGTVDGIPGR